MATLHTLSPNGILALPRILPGGKAGNDALEYLRQGGGDVNSAISKLKSDGGDDGQISRVELALDVFWAFSEDTAATQGVLAESRYKSLRDVALCSVDLSGSLAQAFRAEFSKRIYDLDATGCITSALSSKGFSGVAGVSAALELLKSNPQFSLERDSVWGLAFDASTSEGAAALDLLKALQRLQAVVVSVDELEGLWTAGYRSALQITGTADADFVSRLADQGIKTAEAEAVKRAAATVRARNEHLLMMRAHSSLSEKIDVPVLKAATNGVSLRLIGPQAAVKTLGVSDPPPVEDPAKIVPKPLNLDSLFGNALSVACNDCCSVTSPAAYFVDLLQFLDKIDLSALPGSQYPTVLDGLTARRPDLRDLQLSCENTDVALPYIDLSNEILDACVAYQSPKEKDTADLELPAFNVSADDESAALIEAPKNVSVLATDELSKAISVNLPYDYEADRLQQALDQLEVPWTKLLELFRSRSKSPTTHGQPSGAPPHGPVDRSVVSAHLNITELDYDYMTSQPETWPALDAGEKSQRNVWGYVDISQQRSLRVKEFSASAGVLVDDLLGLLDTPYINPAKFDLSQLQVDFLELVAPYGDKIKQRIDDDRVGVFLDTKLLDATQFKVDWLSKTAPRLKDTVVANLPASDGILNLNDMTLGLLAGPTGQTLSPAHFQKFWTVFKLAKSKGWTLAQTSKALYRSEQLARPSTGEQMLVQLSYVVRLADLLSLTVDNVLGLWVTFTGTAAGSDYARVFLRHELVDSGGPSYICRPDPSGSLAFENPGAPVEMSLHEPEVAAALGCTVQDLQNLLEALRTTVPEPILASAANGTVRLTLANLSILYRWNALRKAIGLDSSAFSKFISVFPRCLDDARSAFETLRDWQRLEATGVSIDTLHQALHSDSPPSQGLSTAAAVKGASSIFTLRRAWADLQLQLPNVATDAAVADEDVRLATQRLYDAPAVESIVSFLNGTYIYFDETIPSSPPVFVDDTLGPDCSKITSQPVDASHFSLRIVGLLSDDEAKAIVNSVDQNSTDDETIRRLSDAVEWARSTPANSQSGAGEVAFNALMPRAHNDLIHPQGLHEALLRPDDPTSTKTADEKRRQYLSYFNPIAREYLIHKAINDELQSKFESLSPLALEFLLHSIQLGDSKPASGGVSLGTAAQKLAEAISPDVRLADDDLPVTVKKTSVGSETQTEQNVQAFYLDVGTADSYTFSLSGDTTTTSVTVAGNLLVFEANGNSQRVTLPAQVCPIQLVGPPEAIERLEWQRAGVLNAPLPPSSLMTSADVDGRLSPAWNALSILSDLAVTFALDTDELVYFVSTSLLGVRFSSGEADASLTIDFFHDIGVYCEARALLISLSTKSKSLLSLLKWALGSTQSTVQGVNALGDKLHELYGWDSGVCITLLSANGLSEGVKNSEFVRQILLLLEQLNLVKKLGAVGKPASVQALLDLASPVASPQPSDLEKRDATVSKIVVLAAGKASSNQRQQMHNRLRERRRDALVDYLTQCEYFRRKEIADADALFEHLLIDSQINSAMLTSRLKQAISTIQLYVQRCLLGLEAVHGVPSDTVDAKEWEWMQKYTLWQANREVFLYPENWLDPSLRPLKSEQYQKFETRLTAGDATPERLEPAIRDYITAVVSIANLEPVALYWDTPDTKGLTDIGRPSGRVPTTLHIFARTRHKPYLFYYRTRDCQSTQYFTPWERVDVDIPVYETDPSGKPLPTPGVYMVVYRANGRLIMILPQFSVAVASGGPTSISGADGQYTATSAPSTKSWNLQFGISEYVNGKWTAKQVFNDIIPSRPFTGHLDMSSGEEVFGEYVYPPPGFMADSHQTCYQDLLGQNSPAAIDHYRFWPYRATGDDKKTVRLDVSWYSPCKFGNQKPQSGHRCAVAQVVFRCGRLQPGIKAPDIELYSKAPSSAPAISHREVWRTVFSKAVAQFDVPKPSNGSGTWPAYLDDRVSPVHFDEGVPALFSFQDQQNWTDSSPLVCITEPNATNIGLASALNFDPRIPPTWDEKTEHGDVLRIPLVHAQADDLASRAVSGIDSVYDYLQGLDPTDYRRFTTKGELTFCDDASLAFGPDAMEMSGPYSQYNAELGLHMPMAMMARFAASQQFDAALAAARLIFNPLERGIKTDRCWKWPPFRVLDVVNDVQKLLANTKEVGDNKEAGDSKETGGSKETGDSKETTKTKKAGNLRSAVLDWRANPFSPYAVARSRPSTYMKWVVAKYIEVLISYGDSYFRQNTLESIPYALNLYVQASKLFGPAPQTMRDPGTKRTATYKSLKIRLDAFSDALVDMEVQFPFVVRSADAPDTAAVADGHPVTMTTNVVAAATTNYFCLPPNPKLKQLKDLIDDRLYKIRNYLDINGHAQVLPLFDPPLDPGALVNAVAGGQTISQVSSGAGATMPNFRFPYLLGKALELASELKQLSSAFLSAKTNGDAERMAAMRAQQEATINAAVMQLKKAQLEEATKSLETLRESRRGPVMRLQHYLALIGEPASRIPGPGADFSEIDAQIEAPTKDSLRMSPFEKLERDGQAEAADWNLSASGTSLEASFVAIIPDTEENIMPFGGGVTLKIGTGMAVQALNAVANYFRFRGEAAGIDASSAGRSAQMVRQLQERRLQANAAGREIKMIDKQIQAQQARVDAAGKDIEMEQVAIDHSAMTIEYLRTKYTNVQLFDWMEARVRSSLYATYTLAYDMAKRAEMAYAFERGGTGDSGTSFVGAGSWDAAHDGLLCGDGLYLGLKKMDAAYVETRGHDFEISRHISLRALTPLGLLQLRATGAVEFALPELLFDLDFPGHYRRRIRSVALSVPCVVGPYTSVSCTLRLLEHKYRYSALGAVKAADYPEAAGGADARFRTNLVPTAAIAAGSAQADSGVFELSFRDERYLPFEGAGAVSRWRLELPQAVRMFDYDSIADVLLHVRYTAADGGEGLKAAAQGAAASFLGRAADASRAAPLVALLDLKNDFPSEWHRFAAAAPGSRTLTLAGLQSRLPFYARPVTTRVPVASRVVLVPEAQLPDGWGASLRSGKDTAQPFAAAKTELSFTQEATVTFGFDEDWVFELAKTKVKTTEVGITGGDGEGEQEGGGVETELGVLDRMWLVVYYSLKEQKPTS